MQFVKNIITTIPNKINCIIPNDNGVIRNGFILRIFCSFSSYFLLSVILFVCQKGGDDMQKENELTVGQWCDQWFTTHHYKWNGNTEGGYRNLIYSHIIPQHRECGAL